MTDLQGRTVVVTGAFGALGRVVARSAADRGAVVAALDMAYVPQGDLGLGEGAVLLGEVDLSDLAAAEAAMAKVKAQTGRLDVLLNIAGGFRWQTLADGDIEGWDRLYAMNVRLTATACKAALPYLPMDGSGRIVNVGAAGALKAGAGMGAYAAAKSGVHRLTESLAEELKGRVTVNAVLPSIIDTPTNRKDMPDADFAAWVRPDELAAVMLFLASPEAQAVTGALLPVTGRV
ncbi:MAG: SDR family NAD(P)-dependent oxidoreductase [Caulobacteraceae bacterium]